MSILRLIVREIAHRKLNSLLGLTAIVAAVALFVGPQTFCAAMQRETTRLMRDMGFNLLILPEGADMVDFWRTEYAQEEMPEQYVHDLADSRIMTVRHLVAQLQKKVEWRGRTVLLTGILPEVQMAHRGVKSPMGMEIPRGEVTLGYELARSSNVKPGDMITLEGEKKLTFEVSRCFERPSGNKDDIRIYAHLHDVQELLGKQGRINIIEALSCRCEDERADLGLERIREDIQRLLPGARVSMVRNIALARERTRGMVEKYVALLLPGVLGACALWVGLLALGNVRERRSEIGILRALGVGSGRVAALFLGKAVLLGFIGAVLGFALGTELALHFGPKLFPLTAKHVAPMYSLLLSSAIGAPVLCAVASYIPSIVAVTQDPAVTLTRE